MKYSFLEKGMHKKGDLVFLKYIVNDNQYPILADSQNNVYCNEFSENILDIDFKNTIAIEDCFVAEFSENTELYPYRTKDGIEILADMSKVRANFYIFKFIKIIGNKPLTHEQKILVMAASH